MLRKYFNFVFPLIFFIVIIIFSSIAIITNINKKEFSSLSISPLIGKNSPEIFIESLTENEKIFQINKFIGKPLIINFFASWCIPCQIENKHLIEISKNYQVVGIAYKDSPKNTFEFLKKFGNPYINIGDDKFGEVGLAWGIYGIPETFVLDKHGVIKFKHAGPIDKKIKNEILNFLNNSI